MPLMQHYLIDWEYSKSVRTTSELVSHLIHVTTCTAEVCQILVYCSALLCWNEAFADCNHAWVSSLSPRPPVIPLTAKCNKKKEIYSVPKAQALSPRLAFLVTFLDLRAILAAFFEALTWASLALASSNFSLFLASFSMII